MNRVLRNIEGYAEDAPNSTAVGLANGQITYVELVEKAGSIAAWLLSEGLNRNDRVALFFDREEAELYPSMLGVLMAGGCFLPVSAKMPPEKQNDVISVSNAKFLLASDKVDEARAICEAAQVANPDEIIGKHDRTSSELDEINGSDQDLAYVLFTSGTTGSPKGVMVNRGNFESFLEWGSSYVGAKPDDRFSNHSESTFDLSLFDIFVAWNSGASVYPVTNMMERSCPGDFIRRNGITIWFSVPSVVGMMKIAGQMKDTYLQTVRRFLFCGEPLLSGQISAIREVFPAATIDNLYGPTEATIACSAFSIPLDWREGDDVSIGRKTAGTEVFVWNHEEQRLCHGEEIGEILISGDQVGPGYLDSPEAGDRFLDDPRFPRAGVSCYRSGDLGVEGEEGLLCRGRVDDQIKFRGWRIELTEIDEALSKVETESRSISVLLNPSDPISSKLVAVLEVENLDAGKEKEVLGALEGQLPDYMIPSEVRAVGSFPLNANGKIDRKAVTVLVEGGV